MCTKLEEYQRANLVIYSIFLFLFSVFIGASIIRLGLDGIIEMMIILTVGVFGVAYYSLAKGTKFIIHYNKIKKEEVSSE